MSAEVLTPATASSPSSVGPSPTLPDAAQRGVLTLQPRVLARLATHAIELHGDCAAEPTVEVRDSSPDNVELEASLVLVYPEEPLAPSLNRLRQQVAADVERQTGRPVGRLDLRVERFATPRPTRRVE
ncbi:MAG: hypothetical protein ACK4V6_10505 [Microthrixaceae bacterium]